MRFSSFYFLRISRCAINLACLSSIDSGAFSAALALASASLSCYSLFLAFSSFKWSIDNSAWGSTQPTGYALTFPAPLFIKSSLSSSLLTPLMKSSFTKKPPLPPALLISGNPPRAGRAPRPLDSFFFFSSAASFFFLALIAAPSALDLS